MACLIGTAAFLFWPYKAFHAYLQPGETQVVAQAVVFLGIGADLNTATVHVSSTLAYTTTAPVLQSHVLQGIMASETEVRSAILVLLSGIAISTTLFYLFPVRMSRGPVAFHLPTNHQPLKTYILLITSIGGIQIPWLWYLLQRNPFLW